VNKIPDYCTRAPRFIFLAEHSRSNHYDSDQLKDAKEDGTDPPPHVSVPPELLDSSIYKYAVYRITAGNPLSIPILISCLLLLPVFVVQFQKSYIQYKG